MIHGTRICLVYGFVVACDCFASLSAFCILHSALPEGWLYPYVFSASDSRRYTCTCIASTPEVESAAKRRKRRSAAQPQPKSKQSKRRDAEIRSAAKPQRNRKSRQKD